MDCRLIDSRHSVTTVRVRYSETDQMHMAYYANHFIWMEVARTNHFRALGVPYGELEKKGVLLPVAEAHCKYRKPARYEDDVEVHTAVTEVKRASIRIEYQLKRPDDGALLSEGWTLHPFTDLSGKVVPVPAELKSKLE